jgi:hypothetical protein
MNEEETQFKSAKRKELEEGTARGDPKAIEELEKLNRRRDQSRKTRENRTEEQYEAKKKNDRESKRINKLKLEEEAAEGDPEAIQKLEELKKKSSEQTLKRRDELKRKIELGDEKAINEIRETNSKQLVRTKKNLLLNPKVMTDEQMRRKREYDLNRVNRIRGKYSTLTDEQKAELNEKRRTRRRTNLVDTTGKNTKVNKASMSPHYIADDSSEDDNADYGLDQQQNVAPLVTTATSVIPFDDYYVDLNADDPNAYDFNEGFDQGFVDPMMDYRHPNLGDVDPIIDYNELILDDVDNVNPIMDYNELNLDDVDLDGLFFDQEDNPHNRGGFRKRTTKKRKRTYKKGRNYITKKQKRTRRKGTRKGRNK